MKRHIILILATIASSIALFVIGDATFRYVFSAYLPEIEGVEYFLAGGDGQKMATFFSFIASLVPVFLAILWFFFKIDESWKRVLSIIIVSFCMLLAVFIKRQIMILALTPSTNGTELNKMLYKSRVNLSTLDFNNSLLLGLCIGCFIVAIVYHFLEKNIKKI
jgi:fatty acid desaturase